jgi:hypothetical protein
LALTSPSQVYTLSHDLWADYDQYEHIDWRQATDKFSTVGSSVMAGGLVVGTNSNATVFNTNGVLSFTGDAIPTRHLRITANNVSAPGASAAILVQRGASVAYAYADNLIRETQTAIPLADNMYLGRPIRVDWGWSTSAINQTCIWDITYTILALGHVITTNEYGEQVQGYSTNVANGLVCTGISISGTRFTGQDVCLDVTLKRIGNAAADTLGASAFLQGMILTYTRTNLFE